MSYFVISDIHGHNDKLEQVLRSWNPDNQQLVLLGDYIDRGPDALAVLKKVKELRDNYGAVVMKGNHEEFFMDWFTDPETENSHYFQHIGLATLLSFLKHYTMKKNTSLPHVFSSKNVRDYIQNTYSDLIQMIKEMHLYYETDNYIFTHAGFNVGLRNWKNSSDQDFLWIREAFLYQPNETGKIAVVGHTNTRLLHGDGKNTSVWIDQWQSKVCVDGGAGSNLSLNGVLLDSKGDLSKLKVYQV